MDDVRRKLKAEGFESVDGHLESRSLTKQLRAMLKGYRDGDREH